MELLARNGIMQGDMVHHTTIGPPPRQVPFRTHPATVSNLMVGPGNTTVIIDFGKMMFANDAGSSRVS